jgi:hypothetical protein
MSENIFALADEDRQQVLAKMYKAKQHPVCPCRQPGVEMYIAKVNDRFIIKRMPNSGPQHSPDCDSYEPPPELSGLGEVLGSAIKENTDEGTTELKFGFSMAKISGRAAVTASSTDNDDSVKADGNKLTLKSVLHYLWEEAAFNKWAPAMAGKRSWYVIRKHLLQAAESKVAKGDPLSERIYIPEPFALEKKSAIEHRRNEKTARLRTMHGKQRELMMFIGEVKEFGSARFGHKMVIKHAPDFHFLLAEDIYKRLMEKYEQDLDLWRSLEDTHLMVVGTFSLNTANQPIVEEASLMMATANWIPMEDISDKAIIDLLTSSGRRFVKGLRYNLARSKPLASVVLTDTTPPTAMYALPADAQDDYIAALDSLMEESRLTSWQWDTNNYEIPEIPAATPAAR